MRLHPQKSAVVTLLLTSTTLAQQCYFPDGSPADLYGPCGGDSQHCCYNTGPDYNDACYSNGFCHSWVLGYTYRGACTDKAWGDGCTQACADTQKNDIQPVSLCGGSSDTSISSAYACCGTPPEAAECCESGDEGGGFGWYNASIVNFELTPKTVVTSMIGPTTSGESQPTKTNGGFSSVSTDPSSTSSPSSSEGDDGNGDDGNDDEKGDPLERKGNQIALGCGLGIGLATLLVTSWGVWKQRSRISPITFLRMPSARRPGMGAHKMSDQVPLQAATSPPPPLQVTRAST